MLSHKDPFYHGKKWLGYFPELKSSLVKKSILKRVIKYTLGSFPPLQTSGIKRGAQVDQITQQLEVRHKFNRHAPSNFPHTCSHSFFVITPYPLSLLTPLNFAFKWVWSTYCFDKLRDNF